jgi:hypothetical protein
VRQNPCFLAAATSRAVLVAATPAFADASAWAFFGGGAMGWKQTANPSVQPAGTMIVDGGVGTSPEGRFIVGGVFRFQPVFKSGVDISLLTRFCNHGFQVGDWGFAVDAGAFARAWGAQAIGFSGSVSLGMPLGITLMLTTEAGTDHAVSFGAVAGVDLLRLTLYRQTLLDWWQNPSSSGKQTARAGGLSLRF